MMTEYKGGGDRYKFAATMVGRHDDTMIRCTADLRNLFGVIYTKTFCQIHMRVVALG